MKDTAWIDGRVFGYARTSTDKQDLELQVAELEAAGCKVVTEQFSGKDRDGRPKLQRLLRELEPGDTLIVYKLDRLSRSLRDVVNILYEVAEPPPKGKGVNFRSLHDPIDTVPKEDPFEEAMRQATINMLATFAELERGFIVARTSAGRKHARENGIAFGRDPALTPSQVEYAHWKRSQPNPPSVAALARELEVHRATLYRYLNDSERGERAGKVLAERQTARPRRRGKKAARR